MTSRGKGKFAAVAAVAAGIVSLLPAGAAAVERPVAVSPGELDRSPEIAGPCPTFIWAHVPGAIAFELAVFELTAPENPEPVLRRRVEGAASAWSPARADCLAPGRSYAWSVRPLFGDRRDAAPEGAWSASRRFGVPGQPTSEEVAAALEVLRRWRSGESPAPASPSRTDGSATVGSSARAVEVSGTSSVRGENPATTGAQFGVTGQSGSTAGAGLVGINLSSGPDLILDGAAQGQPDTLFSQAGIDRPSAAAQTFNVQNSGAGAMTLQVDGATVWTSANDGAGSNLDADLLDGLGSASFAQVSHQHLGESWTGNLPVALTISNESPYGIGLLGRADATSGVSDGVKGVTSSGEGSGVRGSSQASWGGAGVIGEANTFGGIGVYGSVFGVSTGIGVNGATNAPTGTGVLGDATAVTGVNYGVVGRNISPEGFAGHFSHSADGVALYASGSGGWRDRPALRVLNTNAVNGIAAYVTNVSGVATAHLANSGTGEVFYLQNGGTDEAGAGGGDFVRAVNNPETDIQFRVLSSGEVRSDVGFYTPAADFAEMLPGEEGLEPGDVLAIGPDGRLVRSCHRFEAQVAGVYSTRPGFVGGHPVEGALADQVPLAVVGIVPVKVSAENGAIAPGDLLVASDTPGHAMRGGPGAGNGTVIGKALAPHTTGTGVISMLVVLQ